jgi:4-amino-4-deoxy-L-arabinose transferase-like glycosyltransferase
LILTVETMHDHANPQNTLRRYGAPLLFLVAVIIVWYSYFQIHFAGLQAGDAMQYGAAARNLLSGRGFTEGSIWPRELLYTPRSPFYANRIQPFLPLVVTGIFAIFGVSDIAVAVASGLFFVLLIPAVFLLGRVLYGEAAAWLTALLVLFDRTMLQFSISGLTELTFAFLLVFPLLLVTRWHSNPGRWVAGMVLGLAFLTRPGAIVYLLPIIIYVAVSDHDKSRFARFLLGFIITLLPFLAWKYVRFGDPFLEVNSVLLLRNSTAFPGETIVRLIESVSPFSYVISHPDVLLRKLISGIERYYGAIWRLTNPYIMAVFVVAAFQIGTAIRERDATVGFRLLVYILFGLGVILASVTSPEEGVRLLVPFVPLLVILASERLIATVKNWGASHAVRGIAITLFAIFVVWPTWYYDFYRFPVHPQNRLWPQLGAILQTSTRPGDLVISNHPNELCWYGNREVLELPLSLADVESRTRIDAIFLTSQVRLGSDSGIWKEVYATERVPGYYLAARYEVEGVKAWLFKKGQTTGP